MLCCVNRDGLELSGRTMLGLFWLGFHSSFISSTSWLRLRKESQSCSGILNFDHKYSACILNEIKQSIEDMTHRPPPSQQTQSHIPSSKCPLPHPTSKTVIDNCSECAGGGGWWIVPLLTPSIGALVLRLWAARPAFRNGAASFTFTDGRDLRVPGHQSACSCTSVPCPWLRVENGYTLGAEWPQSDPLFALTLCRV